MKKCITVIAGALLFALVAAAQADVPRYEAFLGFTYVRANEFNQNTGLGQAIGGYSMYGGSGQFQYNFNKWISGVGDFGAVNKPNVGIVNAQNTTAFTLGGPRIYWRKGHHWAPFAEVLFGAAYRAISTEVNAVTVCGFDGFLPCPVTVVNPAPLFPQNGTLVTARLSTVQTAFTMMAGGGLDWRFNKHFSLRPVEVDYVLTRFPSPSTGFRSNQSSIMASTGVVFTFGEQ
jgi:hypothetical protein